MSTTEKITPEQLQSDLAQFNGSENWYLNTFGLKFTDGVKYLAEKAGAYWLIDAIESHVIHSKAIRYQFRTGGFVVVRLTVKDGKAWLRFYTDWSDSNPKLHKPIRSQRIQYTDFPLPSIKLYLENGVVCLPRER